MMHYPGETGAADAERHAVEHAGPPNRVRALQPFGQSAWLDDLRRSLLLLEDGVALFKAFVNLLAAVGEARGRAT